VTIVLYGVETERMHVELVIMRYIKVASEQHELGCCVASCAYGIKSEFICLHFKALIEYGADSAD
jgi:hypothetical protein